MHEQHSFGILQNFINKENTNRLADLERRVAKLELGNQTEHEKQLRAGQKEMLCKSLAEKERSRHLYELSKNANFLVSYQAPSKPVSKPLSNKALIEMYMDCAEYQEESMEMSGWFKFARAIEKAHGIGLGKDD